MVADAIELTGGPSAPMRTTLRGGGNDAQLYTGTETIWLGRGDSRGVGGLAPEGHDNSVAEWPGELHGARIFPEALSEEDVAKVCAATMPVRLNA